MKILLIVVYTVLMCGVLYVSSDPFYVAHGSEAGIPIFTASVNFKGATAFLSVLMFCFALYKKSWKYLLSMLGCSILLTGLASHTVVLNHKRAVLEDQWFLYPFHRLNYNIADGIGLDWRIESVLFGFQITAKTSDESVYLFTGPAPWKTPFNELLERN
ncbi:hypothetical protein [Motiliproteus sp. MSK22-1]|uniref:hypothetical protein n=1 Tax=Motiliproteus sp. MSK22-1 TaxID=1897630 RepID=UPI000976CBBA|nr:hypothetical protein [Motiliproteus sp. MSK22-1]OMH39751.1 hypothetical protein BGP75_01465 [Motiliproteus sp. MSK22-1]